MALHDTPGVQNDDAWFVLEQNEQLSVDLVTSGPPRHADVVLDTPVTARCPVAAAAIAAVFSSSSAGGSRQRVERVDEAVVGVRVLADDWDVVPAISVQDADDRWCSQRSRHVQL